MHSDKLAAAVGGQASTSTSVELEIHEIELVEGAQEPIDSSTEENKLKSPSPEEE